jgi:hypothetical protein
LVSARFAEPEAGGCSVGDDESATDADDLTTFTLGLVAEGAEVLMANAAGSDWKRCVSLAAVILDFDRLVDTAVGAGDGVVWAAVHAEFVNFHSFFWVHVFSLSVVSTTVTWTLFGGGEASKIRERKWEKRRLECGGPVGTAAEEFAGKLSQLSLSTG